ncbi:MAG: hypothetical protein AVDCRST_MAG27-898, partial [uncultured Craurococcus sp.]
APLHPFRTRDRRHRLRRFGADPSGAAGRPAATALPPRHPPDRPRGGHLRLARPGRLPAGVRRHGPPGQQLRPGRGLRPARLPARGGRRREAL